MPESLIHRNIITECDPYSAHDNRRWSAHFGAYADGDLKEHGSTEAEAVAALLNAEAELRSMSCH